MFKMGEVLKTILGTVKGANNEGSSKRITAAYLSTITITLLTVTYCIGFYISYNSHAPTKVHVIITDIYLYVLGFVLVALMAVLGLTNIDKWIDIIPFKRGNNPPEKKDETPKTDA